MAWVRYAEHSLLFVVYNKNVSVCVCIYIRTLYSVTQGRVNNNNNNNLIKRRQKHLYSTVLSSVIRPGSLHSRHVTASNTPHYHARTPPPAQQPQFLQPPTRHPRAHFLRGRSSSQRRRVSRGRKLLRRKSSQVAGVLLLSQDHRQSQNSNSLCLRRRSRKILDLNFILLTSACARGSW